MLTRIAVSRQSDLSRKGLAWAHIFGGGALSLPCSCRGGWPERSEGRVGSEAGGAPTRPLGKRLAATLPRCVFGPESRGTLFGDMGDT
jgi:hypothetical protein